MPGGFVVALGKKVGEAQHGCALTARVASGRVGQPLDRAGEIPFLQQADALVADRLPTGPRCVCWSRHGSPFGADPVV
jgi:hypothetical protein